MCTAHTYIREFLFLCVDGQVVRARKVQCSLTKYMLTITPASQAWPVCSGNASSLKFLSKIHTLHARGYTHGTHTHSHTCAACAHTSGLCVLIHSDLGIIHSALTGPEPPLFTRKATSPVDATVAASEALRMSIQSSAGLTASPSACIIQDPNI